MYGDFIKKVFLTCYKTRQEHTLSPPPKIKRCKQTGREEEIIHESPPEHRENEKQRCCIRKIGAGCEVPPGWMLRYGGKPPQVFYAGDDEGAKKTVCSLIESIGFEPVDAGPLRNARNLEPIGFQNIWFGYAGQQGTQIAPTWLHR